MKNMLFGLCIVAELALMGSEGPYFPIHNITGAGVLLVLAALIPRPSVLKQRMPRYLPRSASLPGDFRNTSLRKGY